MNVHIGHACLLCLVLAGCAQTPATTESVPVEDRSATSAQSTQPAQAADASARTQGVGADGAQVNAMPGGTTADPLHDPASPLSKRVVYFDYDSDAIRAEFQPLLQAHAAYLKANKAAQVNLQGHADERGSREYNLALGQRRSESVRKALGLLGVADSQVEAVSYGEEKAAVEGHDEAAWRMNRRVEIRYKGE